MYEYVLVVIGYTVQDRLLWCNRPAAKPRACCTTKEFLRGGFAAPHARLMHWIKVEAKPPGEWQDFTTRYACWALLRQ
jgi:hypothetical protein